MFIPQILNIDQFKNKYDAIIIQYYFYCLMAGDKFKYVGITLLWVTITNLDF